MTIAIDKRKFYRGPKFGVAITLFGGSLEEGQVDGMEHIIDFFIASKCEDRRWLAYALATAYHETARTMQPVRETLASSDESAIRILDKAFAKGRLRWVKTPYWRKDAEGKSWLGRGFVQLTHKDNYSKLARRTGIDLLAVPAAAMNVEVATEILYHGMTEGLFTGKKLSDFFNATKSDPINARKIINGTDRAADIARYYQQFLQAIGESDGRT